MSARVPSRSSEGDRTIFVGPATLDLPPSVRAEYDESGTLTLHFESFTGSVILEPCDAKKHAGDKLANGSKRPRVETPVDSEASEVSAASAAAAAAAAASAAASASASAATALALGFM